MITENENFITINKEFPHIGHKIEIMWGHPECAAYFKNLLNDTRDGTRQGFPKHIASALFKLSVLHDELFPGKPNFEDIWLRR